MKRTLSLVALSSIACSSGDDTVIARENLEAMGRVALAVTLPDEERDVSRFVVTIHPSGSTCSGPPLEVLELPLALDGTPGALPTGAESSRPFADGIVVLQAGTYLACAQPQLAVGAPSQQCALAERSFTVEAGSTVDVLLVSQCQGAPTGAAAVSAALNSPPAILSLDIAPTRFVAPCESATLEADVQDPDGDPITIAWSVVDAPETALAELIAAGASATFEGDTPGQYTVALTATDPFGSASSLEIPLVVNDVTSSCGCAAGTQDNDDDGVCSPDCASTDCAGICDDSSGTAICQATRTVFVTSTTTMGGFGGVFGGDAICQARAAAAGLPGTYLAWLSDPGAAPAGRFTQSTNPYVMVDGTLIATGWADLIDGTIAHAIDRTELNTQYTGAVWTSTAPDGTFVGSVSCNGWTALGSNVTGLNGSSTATTGPWTQAGGTFCNNAFPLYCFQQ
jgi:hypothetical protein